MKIWLFVVGVFFFSFLFFLAGAFVGYDSCNRHLLEKAEEEMGKKLPRVARESNCEPIIGRPLSQSKKMLQEKSRHPSQAAIEKSKTYKH